MSKTTLIPDWAKNFLKDHHHPKFTTDIIAEETFQDHHHLLAIKSLTLATKS
jgi:hypothetical protein